MGYQDGQNADRMIESLREIERTLSKILEVLKLIEERIPAD